VIIKKLPKWHPSDPERRYIELFISTIKAFLRFVQKPGVTRLYGIVSYMLNGAATMRMHVQQLLPEIYFVQGLRGG